MNIQNACTPPADWSPGIVRRLLDRAGIRVATLARVMFDFATVALVVPVLVLLGVANVDRATGPTSTRTELEMALLAGLVLGSVSVNVFSLRGFYRQNRLFRPRHKVRAVIQGVAISHLIFLGIAVIARSIMDVGPMLFVISAVADVVILSAARLGVSKIPGARALLNRLEEPQAGDTEQTVLVVGGGGYIGSALLTRLLAKGYKVRLLDLLIFGEEPIREALAHPNLELIRGDFRRVDCVVKAAQGVDTVVHLGAIVGDPACEVDQRLTIDTNLVAAQMVAEVSKAAGARRFVFASTCSVYGAADGLLSEESELNPVSLYARTKIACEEALTQMQDDQMSVVILRFGTIYGFSGRTRFDLVVNLLTAKAVIDGEITVFGGDQWRPFLHVDDASAAVLAAVEAPGDRIAPQVFNVGSDEQNMTITQLGEMIGAMVPSAKVVHLGSDGDMRDYRVDFSRIQRYLEFRPAWTLEMGIQQVIEAITSGRVADYTDPIHSNVKVLQADKAASPEFVERRRHQPGRVQLSYRLQPLDGPWTAKVIGSPAPEAAASQDDNRTLLADRRAQLADDGTPSTPSDSSASSAAAS